MKRIVLVAAASVLVATPGAAAAGQLGLMKAGKLQCYAPNAARHTCQAIAGYTFGVDGITNQAQVLLTADPLGVMTTNSPVTFSGETICGPLRKSDIDNATITINGKPAPPDVAANVKAKVLEIEAKQLDKQICTTYAPAGADYTATVTVDGVADPGQTALVSVIDPKDGYTLGPEK